jgi:cytochrome c peroxidase
MNYPRVLTQTLPVLIALGLPSTLLAQNSSLPAPASDADFYNQGTPDAAKVELGRLLFSDKLLSGNLNISCASCHHALAGTGDGLSLPIGEGGNGLGVTRDTGTGADAVHERVPRNAPPVFNLGAREFHRMFHDGRVEGIPSNPDSFISPAGDELPPGLDNVLAVQAMFPVTSAAEMAGQPGENPQADAASLTEVWEILAAKLQAIPDYVTLFQSVYPGDVVAPQDLTYVHAANAIAAFEADAWRFDNSPFDQYLRGDHQALSVSAQRGMRLFYGKAGCAGCHAGVFQTDHEFHAIAMPQIGPGKGDGVDVHEDFGRERVTGSEAERYRFRTPTLRNIALTAPYGHDGAYNSLAAVVRHHLDPQRSLSAYDPEQRVLPSRPDLDALDMLVTQDLNALAAIAAANELGAANIRAHEMRNIMAFLLSLTDPEALDMRSDVPTAVPSGLPLQE